MGQQEDPLGRNEHALTPRARSRDGPGGRIVPRTDRRSNGGFREYRFNPHPAGIQEDRCHEPGTIGGPNLRSCSREVGRVMSAPETCILRYGRPRNGSRIRVTRFDAVITSGRDQQDALTVQDRPRSSQSSFPEANGHDTMSGKLNRDRSETAKAPPFKHPLEPIHAPNF
jgi:hypothetical protein